MSRFVSKRKTSSHVKSGNISSSGPWPRNARPNEKGEMAFHFPFQKPCRVFLDFGSGSPDLPSGKLRWKDCPPGT